MAENTKMSREETNRIILKRRFEEHKTLKEIGNEFGCSKQAVWLVLRRIAKDAPTRVPVWENKPTKRGRCSNCNSPLVKSDIAIWKKFPQFKSLCRKCTLPLGYEELKRRTQEKTLVTLVCRDCGKEKTYLLRAYLTFRGNGQLSTVDDSNGGLRHTYLCRECLYHYNRHSKVPASQWGPNCKESLPALHDIQEYMCILCGKKQKMNRSQAKARKYTDSEKGTYLCVNCVTLFLSMSK